MDNADPGGIGGDMDVRSGQSEREEALRMDVGRESNPTLVRRSL